MNTLKGFSYKDNPAKPVAGKNDTLFFEESGISETLDKAYGYALNALKFGNIITGSVDRVSLSWSFISFSVINENYILLNISQYQDLMKVYTNYILF
jgi:hypothetical protein